MYSSEFGYVVSMAKWFNIWWIRALLASRKREGYPADSLHWVVYFKSEKFAYILTVELLPRCVADSAMSYFSELL